MSDVNLREIALRGRAAGRSLALLPAQVRNAAILETARRLEAIGPDLWEANAADLVQARTEGVSPALLDRATLNPRRVASMVQGCREVAAFADPLNQEFDGKTTATGLRVIKRRVPLGLIGVIFESRPNVTTEIGALTLKSGNAVLMRGGRECLRTNIVLVDLIRAACEAAGAPADAVQVIRSTDRALVPALLGMDDLIDLVIPRGAQGLQNLVRQHARMPVIYGGIGVCHLFVDETADILRSVPLINNAKTQAPSVCNALDTVLVHRGIVRTLVPSMVASLNASGVKVLCDGPSLAALEGAEGIVPSLVAPATPDDYGCEFLSLMLSVKTVDSLEEAIAHIERYGTRHSDGILTNDLSRARRFADVVDSAVVYVNASTRFTDGGQFGLGAEVAISTQRLHARGPLGVQELTTYKWIAEGDYLARP